MADVNANIGVGIDTSDALNQLKNLQRQISQFHSSVAKSSESAAIAQRDLQKNFLNSVNAIQGFSAELRTVRTTAETFTNSLEKNKFSIREYFRYAAGASGRFSKSFAAEFSTIEKVAVERVKTLQTQYIKMGRDAQGAMQAIAIRPTTLNMQDLGTQTAIAAQKQAIFNQLLKQGSTNLLNFGKNTQWAGRQLMVGFTLPLATLGMTAGRVFMDMEKAALKFRKVYGDLFTPTEERDQALADIVELGKEYTAYGVAVSEAVDIAGEAAAAGFQGADLQNQTAAALKLSVLGQLDLNKALETTIALQNAFQLSSANLATEIDFLNAVENQTVVSLDDITTAIPKVAPVIQSLGGDVRDLAFFMAAMKEGGINASEGANALKSGLASLINPSTQASEMLNSLGINLKGIVELNEGNISGVVVGFARALDKLEPLKRAQAIEQLFGKFQFARISALFENVSRDGTQASRVLELAGSTTEELAALAESELGVSAASSMNKFLKAVEQIKVALAPIGELFLQVATPIIEFGTKMLEAFNNLPDGIKKAITTVITVIGGIGPIALMTFGLINNGIANMIKFFATVRLGYLKITGQAQGVGDETQYMTTEQLEAAAAAASLDQAHSNLTQRFTAEKVAVDALRTAYEQAAAAGARFAMLNPGMMRPGSVAKFANGGAVGGSGSGDTVPAMLTPGEFVVKKDVAQRNMALLEALNSGKLPGFEFGGEVGKSEIAAATAKSPARSAAALASFIQRDLGKVLATGNQALLDEFLKFIREFVANAESVTKTSLRDAIMQQETMAKQYAPQRFQGQRTDFAHIGSAQKMTATQAAAGGVNIESTRLTNLVQNISRIIPDLEMTFKSGFGVELSGQVNNLMDKSGASIQAFLEDFDSRGLGKWRKAVEIGGGNFNELEPQLQAYNDSLRQKIQQALDNGATKIVDTQNEVDELRAQALRKGEVFDETLFITLEQLEAETRAGLGQFGDKLNQVIDTALSTITEVILTMTQQQQAELAAAGVNIDFGQRSGGGFRGSGKVALARTAGGVGTFNDTLASTAQTASESKRTVQIAKDTANGYINELERQAPAIADSAAEVGNQARARSGPRRASTSGNVIMDTQSGKFKDEAQTARLLEGRQKGLARATGMAMANVSDFATKMSGATFALSSAAGIASMFGGKVGEAAGAIMQITSLMFALSTVTMGLIRAKTAEATMSMITSLGAGRTAAGAVGAAGGWMGGAKGMAGLKNVLANVGKVFTTFIPVLTRIPPLFLKMIPVIGWIITAITLGISAFNKSRDAVNGLGETANLSADKIKKLGDIFGVEPKAPGFGSAFTGAAATGTAEQRTATQQVLETEGFEQDFKNQIDAIKSAGKQDAERTLAALTLQLSSSGFAPEAVQAIIDAIVTKAGRTDLDLKFASIKFSSADGLAEIQRVANESAARLNESFSKIDIWDNLLGGMGGGQLKTQIQSTAGDFASLFGALKVGFESGEVTAQDFNTQLAGLESAISSLNSGVARETMSAIADNLLADNQEVRDQIKNLGNFKDQLLLVRAAAAGIKIPPAAVKILEEAGKAGADPKVIKDATRLREQFNQMIRDTATATEEANKAQQEQQIADASIQEAIDSMIAEEQQLQNMASAHKTLVDLGYDEATAYTIASNAMYASAIAAATASDAIGTTTGKLAEVLGYMNAMLEAQNKAPVSVSSGGGGGGQKSDFQEAMEQLGKQRKEIQNTIKAYGGLRKAGFSAAEAILVANDATMAAALASKKVGSKEWERLVNQIKLARIEALKTAEGLRGAFGGLKSLADEYFSILERQTDRKYQDSIRGQEKAIDAYGDAIASVNEEIEGHEQALENLQRSMTIRFDRPIEVLQEESSDLSNDLTLMDRAADKITKRYEEQSKALSQVAKVNQQIIGQQKSQMSLADALASGDIGAAAGIMQDMRAAQADAAATTQEEMLNAARDSEIAGLRSAGGMSRIDIEERQFEISQQIFDLEEKREKAALAARDIEDTIYNIQKNKLDPLNKQQAAAEKALKTTNDQKQAELDAIDAQRQRWTDAELALDAARIEAGDFAEVIDMTAGLTGDVVKDWKSLESKTITLTINTVKKALGAAPTAAGITEASGGGGGGGAGKAVIPEIPQVTPAPPAAATAVEDAIDPFAWLKNPEEALTNWWDSIVAWFENLPGNIFNGLQSIDEWLGTQWQNFKTWLSELPYNIGYSAGQLWGNIQNIGIWLATQWENFKTWVTITLPNGIKQWGRDIWSGIQGIPAWLQTQWNNFKTWLTVTLPNGISTWATNLWTKGLPSLGTWLAARANELKNWIQSLPGMIGNWATNLWDGFWSGFKAGESATKNAGQRKATGGMIYRAMGGGVPGRGNTDSVRAMLTPGEYVVNKRATSKFRPLLQSINSGTFGGGMMQNRYSVTPGAYAPRDFNAPVYSMPDRSVPKSQGISSVYGNSSESALSQVDNSVYNYNLSVNVEGSNSSADQIANVVIGKLRNIQSQQVRGQVIR